jgi:hypothetical protein
MYRNKRLCEVYNKALKRFEKYGLFDELEMDTVT